MSSRDNGYNYLKRKHDHSPRYEKERSHRHSYKRSSPYRSKNRDRDISRSRDRNKSRSHNRDKSRSHSRQKYDKDYNLNKDRNTTPKPNDLPMQDEKDKNFKRNRMKSKAALLVMLEKEEKNKIKEPKPSLDVDFLSNDPNAAQANDQEGVNGGNTNDDNKKEDIDVVIEEGDNTKDINKKTEGETLDEVDPLDEYMKIIEKDATLQDYQLVQLLSTQNLQMEYDNLDNVNYNNIDNNHNEDNANANPTQLNQEQIDHSKIFTFDDLNKPIEAKDNNNIDNNNEDIIMNCNSNAHANEEEDEIIIEDFIKACEKVAEDKTQTILYQEDPIEYLQSERVSNTEEQWKRLKQHDDKGKELKLVNHNEIIYEPFRKQLYIEPQEITDLTQDEVDRMLKDNGNIKLRGKNIPKPIFNWYHCGLISSIVQVIEAKGMEKPFPIQMQSIPCIMSGRDVIGIAETGSGKTLAYVLPMLRHVLDQRPCKDGDGPIALIMVPTRELAVQIYQEIKCFTKFLKIDCSCVYGGSAIGQQISELRRGVEIVVATPGRFIEILCLSNGKITNLRRVTYVVLDEADRMFDMGFEPQISRILANIRPNRQTVMFSATFPRQIESLAKKILTKPIEVLVGIRGQSCKTVKQYVEVIAKTRSFIRLLELLTIHQGKSTIVFVDTQDETIELWKQLFNRGYQPVLLHGGMDQEDRIDSIDKYKKGVSNILISTSVSARGLDVKQCELVINFRCPNHMEDYIHRVGRTGRAGREGVAYTFISPDDEDHFAEDILKVLELSNQEVSFELRELVRNYKRKLENGDADKFRISGYVGHGYQFDKSEKEKVTIERKLLGRGYGYEEEQSDNDNDNDDNSNDANGNNLNKKHKRLKLGSDQDFESKKNALVLRTPSIKEKHDAKMRILSKDAKAKQIAIDVGMNAAKAAIISGKSEEEILPIVQDAITQALAEYKPSVSMQKGVEQAAKIIEDWEEKENEKNHIYTCEFDINDYPLTARMKGTKRDFLKQMSELNNVDVCIKGVFVEMGKKIPIGQKKLYLLIKGRNQSNVNNAYVDIKRSFDENALAYYTNSSGYSGNVERYHI